MKHKLACLLVMVALLAPFYPQALPAHAEVPLQVQVMPEDTLDYLARLHSNPPHQVITKDDLVRENGLKPPYTLTPGTWLTLPDWAFITSDELFTVTASSEWELAGIRNELEDARDYRMMGRQYHLGVSQQKRALIYSCEGGSNSPNDSVVLAATRFNQNPFGHIGIGGGGHGTRVGDMVVSGGVMPGTGSGNIAPVVLPDGTVIIGNFLSYYYGVPVISDAERANANLLRPDQTFLQQLYVSFNKVALPPVNQDVADFMSGFFQQPYGRYTPSLLQGWSVTGPFVTSDAYLAQTEARANTLAGILGVPAPTVIGTDMESWSAIHAYVESGGKNWFVVRIVVDPARELQGQGTPAGVPVSEVNDPSQPFAWSYANNPWYFVSDWSYFQTVPALLVNQAIADLGRTSATVANTASGGLESTTVRQEPPEHLRRLMHLKP